MTKIASLIKISLLIMLTAVSISACTTQITTGPNAQFVPGHYNRYGVWVPGHYMPGSVGPITNGPYVPGHYNRWGGWVPGHSV
jgi:hypothetical protein